MSFKMISPEDWNESAFKVIGKQMLLVGTPEGKHANAMTASWGGFGVLWGKPVVYLWIRPERHTHSLIEEGRCFSVNILPEGMDEVYRICGTCSGRDTDKPARCGLTTLSCEGIPYFAQSKVAALCKLRYQQPMTAGGYCDYALLEQSLAKGELHSLFIGEVVRLLYREDDNTNRV